MAHGQLTGLQPTTTAATTGGVLNGDAHSYGDGVSMLYAGANGFNNLTQWRWNNPIEYLKM